MAVPADPRVRILYATRPLWCALASIAALFLASRHTLPLGRTVLPQHPLVEALGTVTSFTLVGCCVGFAQASMNVRIGIRLIGSLGMAYALAVSFLIYGAAFDSVPQSIVGALLAADGTMLGAWFDKSFLHYLRRVVR